MCTICNDPSHVDPFEGLDDGLANAGARRAPAAPAVRYACEKCGGTGKWRHGHNNNGESKCFACGGKGYFASSAEDRRRARTKRRESAINKVLDAKAAFKEANPGLIEAMVGVSNWNDFAAKLLGDFNTKGFLTEGQVNAIRRTLAKIEQRREERATQQAAAQVEVDLSTIRAMFDAAVRSGLKSPTYRAEGLVISRAPDHGRNAGHLYVKTIALPLANGDVSSGDYQGKIGPDNVFRPVYNTAKETTPALHAIAADPREAAVRYGRRTGNCSCCGRKLTNGESVEAGIGPICATKWSL